MYLDISIGVLGTITESDFMKGQVAALRAVQARLKR